jgi:hypothetical protein
LSAAAGRRSGPRFEADAHRTPLADPRLRDDDWRTPLDLCRPPYRSGDHTGHAVVEAILIGVVDGTS